MSIFFFFFFFFTLKAFMQPQLLGNEFTHLEFPRRVQRKEVGKRMLYRDFTMAGWWVDIFNDLFESFTDWINLLMLLNVKMHK